MFKVKYLGELKYFLGLKFLDPQKVFTYVKEYVFDILVDIDLHATKHSLTPVIKVTMCFFNQ